MTVVRRIAAWVLLASVLVCPPARPRAPEPAARRAVVAPRPSRAFAFRTRLTLGDADRDWTYVGDGTGQLDVVWQANGRPYQAWGETRANDYYDPNFHGGYKATAAGPVSLQVNDLTTLGLTVADWTNKVWKEYVVQPTDKADDVQKKINQGCNLFRFVGTTYFWDKQVNFGAGTKVYGYGATVYRKAVHAPGDSTQLYPIVGCNGPDVSFYGLTFAHDPACGVAVVIDGKNNPGLVVANCRFLQNAVGSNAPQALVRDNVLEGGGAGPAFQGLWLPNRFRGPTVPGYDAFQYWSDVGLLFADNKFEGTNRGLVGNGPQTGQVHAGNEYFGIVGGPNNAHEVELDEDAAPRPGGSVQDCAYLHTRVVACQSDCFRFDGGCTGVTIMDYRQESGGVGINFDSAPDRPAVQYVTVDLFEIRNGGGIYCGKNTANITFSNGTVVGFSPTQCNQGFPNKSEVLTTRTAACVNNGPVSNTFTQVNVLGTAPGLAPIVGFLATD